MSKSAAAFFAGQLTITITRIPLEIELVVEVEGTQYRLDRLIQFDQHDEKGVIVLHTLEKDPL